MGALFFPLSSSHTSTPFSITLQNRTNPKSPSPIPLKFRCIKLIPNSTPRYHSNNAETFQSGRSKFSVDDDELFTDGEDEFGSGFGSGTKRRVWWSDEMVDIEDEDDDEQFWIFKVLKAFGWMVPAVGLSMLLGIGTNTLFMAIALPLGQSVLSFVMDTVWGNTDKRKPRPRSRSQTRRPFTKSASNSTMNEARREEYMRSRRKRASRQTNDRTNENGSKSPSSKYGGWDELVNEHVGEQKHRKVPRQDDGELQTGTGKGKLSRRGRNRETPLFVRLLIAVFPFLGSWSKLML